MSEFAEFEAQHNAIADEIDGRIVAHRKLLAANGGTRLNLLAEGDSWFDYPVGNDSMVRTDVLAHLVQGSAKPPAVLSLAHWGDATTQMFGLRQRNRLRRVLADATLRPFDAILFSGGGNDMAGDTFSLWLMDAAAVGGSISRALNRAAVTAVLGVIEAAYRDLMALRDELAPGVAILTHGYDFARPSGIGVCVVGPWLYPSLRARGWMADRSSAAQDRGAVIVRALLEQFNEMLNGLAAEPGSHLVVVPSQGVLDPQADWANELHPTPGGFAKAATVWRNVLSARFPGRI